MAATRFSLALGGKKTTAAPPPKRKAAFGGHDSDHEDDAEGKAEEVSHFDQDAGGAIHEDHRPKTKEPLVIKGPSNRDWREESRRKRQKTALPGDTKAEEGAADNERRENVAPISYGLNITEKDKEDVKDTDNAKGQSAAEDTKRDTKKPMTDDERALAALLGEKTTSNLVLPHIDTEEQVFERDYREAPDVPTLADYAAVPIEEFGAALLRGMGWKDGEAIGKRQGQQAPKPTVVERRPALLGIGAKQDAAVGVELGAWGKGAKGKKLDQEYTPVLLENKKTGEKLTEEELKAKIENQKMLASEQEGDRSRQASDRDYDSSSRRRKYRDDHDYDSNEKDRRRHDKDRDYDDKRHRSSRRERSSSPDHKHRGKKESRRDHDDRKHRSSKRDRSLSIGSRDRSGKDREKDRKYDDDRHRSSRRARSRSRDRRDPKERRERKEKHRDREDRGDRYEIAAR